jgi:hypothetical protein
MQHEPTVQCKGSVFERVHGKVAERQLQGGFVAACNAAQGTTFGGTKLDQLLTNSTTPDLRGMSQILADPSVLMECNIDSVIFDFHGNRPWLASGEVPAATGRYRGYSLFG